MPKGVDLVGQLIPKVFEGYLSTPIAALQGAAAKDLKLSLLVSAEYLNRSLVFFDAYSIRNFQALPLN
ncbi:unnamed protein product [Dibothriocephalus latus]|uniref:Uncharacterized protein n=1 Tax=Dibothriocephalus latus TaxID=60516 RepID=A0A3P7Q363_DIBLA|nr:unnamed protein product [Dibothriocephalus latus]